MSVENKIKELLGRVDVKASLAESLDASTVSKDTSIKPANAGDTIQPKQGSSADADIETREEDEPNQGAAVSKSIKQNTLTNQGAGAAPNFTTVKESEEPEEEAEEEGEVAEEDIDTNIDLSPIFGDDLSEDFKSKATSIFEAAVIARVNNEMEKVVESLEEKFEEQVTEYKQEIVEKVDSYLNYVVENWMEENKLAVEEGLRTEIAEDFISGLKTLFKEHYIEVPEEKYNVLEELQNKVSELAEHLDTQLENNVSLNSELMSLKRKLIIKEMTDDLADTEAVKLNKLLEGVEFDNADTFKDKVKVIKESYFRATETKSKNVVAQQILSEEANVQEETFSEGTVSVYAKALSRTVKK